MAYAKGSKTSSSELICSIDRNVCLAVIGIVPGPVTGGYRAGGVFGWRMLNEIGIGLFKTARESFRAAR